MTHISLVQTIPENAIRIPIVDAAVPSGVQAFLERLGIDSEARREVDTWFAELSDATPRPDTKYGQIRFLAAEPGLMVLSLFATVVSQDTAARFPQYFDVAHLSPWAQVVDQCQLSTGEVVNVVRLLGIDHAHSVGRNLRVCVAVSQSGYVVRFTGETRTFGRDDELTDEFVSWVRSIQFTEGEE